MVFADQRFGRHAMPRTAIVLFFAVSIVLIVPMHGEPVTIGQFNHGLAVRAKYVD